MFEIGQGREVGVRALVGSAAAQAFDLDARLIRAGARPERRLAAARTHMMPVVFGIRWTEQVVHGIG